MGNKDNWGYKGVKGPPGGRLTRVQGQWEPLKVRLLSLKNNMQKQKKIVKHSSWRGLMKAMREVSGANGKGVILRRLDT